MWPAEKNVTVYCSQVYGISGLCSSHTERERERERYVRMYKHTHNFQHNHCLYSRQMPQWETTTPKLLVNQTVSSAWSHSHRKSLFVRPKKMNSKVPGLGIIVNVPTFPTHNAPSTLWSSGSVRCCSVMQHDNTKAEPFLGSFFKEFLSTCPVCCSNTDSLILDRKLGL